MLDLADCRRCFEVGEKEAKPRAAQRKERTVLNQAPAICKRFFERYGKPAAICQI